MSTSQIIVLVVLLFVFGVIPVALIFHAWMTGREADANHRRNSVYKPVGHDENGTPIYLELPRK